MAVTSFRTPARSFERCANRLPSLLDVFGAIDETDRRARQQSAAPAHRSHDLNEQDGARLIAIVPYFVVEAFVEHQDLAFLPAAVLVGNLDAAFLSFIGNAQAEVDIQ